MAINKKYDKSKPLVSIIIPTYNSMTGTKSIDKTIESILKQTYSNIEILVIDNYSIDNTHEICRKYPIRFFRFKGTRSEARNFGINKMKGEYSFFIDSDHILTQKIVTECVYNTSKYGAECILIPIKFINYRKYIINCSEMRNIDQKLDLGIQTNFLFYSKNIIKDIRYPKKVELFEDAFFISEVLKRKPVITRIKSVIYHFEDGSIKKFIKRSWDYGKKFPLTISGIGSDLSVRFVLNLSVLNLKTIEKLKRLISNGTINPKTLFSYMLYTLIKHLSFGMSYFISLIIYKFNNIIN